MTDKNRLEARIATLQARIDSGTIPGDKLTDLESSLATDTMDLVEYQNLQSQAHAAGKITFDEAQLLYKLLGGQAPSAQHWDKLSIAERVAITQMMSELLDWKIAMGPGVHVVQTTISREPSAGGKKRSTRKSGGTKGKGAEGGIRGLRR